MSKAAASSPTTGTLGDVFNIDLDIAKADNIFAYYVGALFFLAYFLSLFVSSLHTRQDSVVYPLTRPQMGQDFAEYIIVAKTSLLCGSSFDTRGRIIITLKGSFDESPPLHLKKGKGIESFLARGSTNIFVYHSPSNLGDIEEIDVKLINDAPYEIPYVQWRPSFIAVMNPLTREEWGTIGVGRMVCPGVLNKAMKCFKGQRENHGACKALCLFHPIVSLFNSPVRFGMYNNMVNAIFIFFLYSLLMTSVLIVELAFHLKRVKSFSGSPLYRDATLRAFTCAIFCWVFEIVLETLLRNVVPRVSATRYAMFRGLMEPIQSHHVLRDFSINLDWDSVRPLILNKEVTLVRGVIHFGSHSVFSVAHSLRIVNLWGHFNQQEARETDVFMRSMNMCALPLPATLRWLSREASSLKDDIFYTQIESDYSNPMCYFCCWIRDWPVSVLDEPWQNGLVLSHIIARDILELMKIDSIPLRARRAQICVHQWYGLICCLFLQIVRQAMDVKSENCALVNAFVQRTVTQFGKRSAREIQATWRARQQKNISPLKLLASERSGQSSLALQDDNANQALALKLVLNKLIGVSSPSNLEVNRKLDESNEYSDYQEDELLFDDLQDLAYYEEQEKEAFNLRLEAGDLGFTAPKDEKLARYSIIEEASCDRKRTSRHPSCQPGDFRSRRCSSRGLTSSALKANKKELLENENLSPSHENDEKDGCCIDMASDWMDWYDENTNALNLKEEERKKDKEEKDEQIKLLLHQKRKFLDVDEGSDIDMRIACPLSNFESYSLGPPYDLNFERIPPPRGSYLYLRHKDELAGYSCGSKQCLAFVDIHKMVGNGCMEILRRIVQDLLYFAINSNDIRLRDKLWLRKRMVLKIFDDMDKKCNIYEDAMFKPSALSERENYAANQYLTSILTMVEVLIGVASENQKVCAEEDNQRRAELYAIRRNPQARCLYCAKKIKRKFTDPLEGCDDFDKLVKFFTRETIYVAEMEVNAELRHKVTLQRFCAGIMNLAVRELLMELEDPPMVLSAKVTRALLYKMLEVKSPKASTDFREMSADELRRVGTRRERIQARHDASIGRAKKDTVKQKKEKAINTYLVETLSSKWRVSAKENELQYCAHLLAQCLVQEKILGFSIYSGFISKEHEMLLEGSKAHLIEVEKKATSAVLKIANVLLEKRLDQALRERDNIDVVFTKTSLEAGYTLEAVSVMQVLLEPMFLKTCCHYINDLVEHKIAEFIEFFQYMSDFDPLKPLVNVKKLMKETQVKYDVDKKVIEQTVADHGAISTPVLRWGVDAIMGVPPLPDPLKAMLLYEDPETLLSQAVEHGMTVQILEPIISLMLKTRRKAKKAMQIRESEELKKLQLHLARVQARLTEQVALASQNASDTSAVETDFQREYHRDELYNVELYATRDMQRPLGTAFGFFLMFTLVLLTLLLMLFTTIRASNMAIKEAEVWFIAFGKTAAILTFGLQPIKCLLYALLRFYRI